MGRWGHRLFEGDQDLDIACELNNDPDTGRNLGLSKMIHQTDMLAPQEARLYYKTPEYQIELQGIVNENRQKLDSGLGDKLFAYYRAKEESDRSNGPYRVILVGAIMMRAGAKIKDDDLQHLRELVPKINSNAGYTLPMFDQGFRDPGKVQFIAALDHYKPGTPRNFQEPSCFACGKVEADTGKKPLQCSRCTAAPVWYCDRNCQRAHWKAHKPVCKPPSQTFMLNV